MAFVLLNTEIGAQADVIEALKKTEGVIEAYNILGLYDVIARVKAESLDKLSKIVGEKFHIRNVHSKLTILVSES